VGFCGRFPRTALVPRLSWAIIILPFQGGRWSLSEMDCKIWPNQAAEPNRRPPFTFVAVFIFVRLICAPPPFSSAAGEPCREAA